MDPGERNKLVLVEQMTESTGPSGFPIETWTPLTTLWAGKYDERAGEEFKAGQLSASQIIRWELPYRPDLDPDLVDVPKLRRLRYQGRQYDIQQASQIGRQDGVEVTTLAKVG
jgi:SPP1 family predicted phage head-tail adaptor